MKPSSLIAAAASIMEILLPLAAVAYVLFALLHMFKGLATQIVF